MDDKPGFEEFCATQLPGLLRFAYLLTGNRADAEDLTQTTLARACVAWRRVRDSDSPDAYVRKILVNANRRRFRRRRIVETPVAALPEPPEHEDTDLLAVEQRGWLTEALSSLPARQRAVVVLRYCEDLSESEVAAVLGCARGTVKSQASKGLGKLRTHPALLAQAAAGRSSRSGGALPTTERVVGRSRGGAQ